MKEVRKAKAITEHEADHSQEEGGSTRLYPRSDDLEPVDVAPKKGSALFFRHGFGPDSDPILGLRLFDDKALVSDRF